MTTLQIETAVQTEAIETAVQTEAIETAVQTEAIETAVQTEVTEEDKKKLALANAQANAESYIDRVLAKKHVSEHLKNLDWRIAIGKKGLMELSVILDKDTEAFLLKVVFSAPSSAEGTYFNGVFFPSNTNKNGDAKIAKFTKTFVIFRNNPSTVTYTPYLSLIINGNVKSGSEKDLTNQSAKLALSKHQASYLRFIKKALPGFINEADNMINHPVNTEQAPTKAEMLQPLA